MVNLNILVYFASGDKRIKKLNLEMFPVAQNEKTTVPYTQGIKN